MTTNKLPFSLTWPILEEGLVFMGCLLLVLGNFLPWSCWVGFNPLSGCESCETGIFYNPFSLSLRWSMLPVLYAVAILILPLMAKRVRPPIDLVLWLVMAGVSVFLLVPGPACGLGMIPSFFYWNVGLYFFVLLLRIVLPLLSFAAIGLVNSLVAVRRRWPAGLMASAALVQAAVPYLICLAYSTTQPGLDGMSIRLGIGVPLILVGGLLLLCVEANQARLGQPQVDSFHG